MLNINPEIFAMVVETAKHNTNGDARWIAAIDKAVVMLDGNPYTEYRDNELIIMSDTSCNVYTANGSCQCAAYEFHMPCKHRAAAQLVRRYFEALEQLEAEADLDGQVETALLLDGPLPQNPARARGEAAPDAPLAALGGRVASVEQFPDWRVKRAFVGGQVVETVRGIRI
ncbi:MAG TPA: hypothetical protein VF735_09020 [Pyrinomonadaceae bacterium]|jgi:hypothetical protein